MTTADKETLTSPSASSFYDPLASMDDQASVERIHAEADAFFDSIDVNGDGAISMDEMRGGLVAVGYAPGTVDNIFNLLDLNADGELSRAELRASFVRYDDPSLRLALGLGTSEADAVFDKIDVNGDGEITEAELEDHIADTGYGNPKETAATIFATLDVNGDKCVSREELREGYVRYSSLREALGIGSTSRPRNAQNAAKNPKGVPKRWGRGGRRAAAELSDQIVEK